VLKTGKCLTILYHVWGRAQGVWGCYSKSVYLCANTSHSVLPLRDCALSSTDVVVCQVEIPRQEGKSGKSVNRRTEADRSQSVFARVRWRIEGSCAVGWSYSWKTSGEALTPVSRLGVAALYPETARMSRATRTQLSAEVKRDGGRAMVLEPYRIAIRSAPRPRQSSCWRTYWAAVWRWGRWVLPKR
jgi:hypothetical protein